jgi:sigma-B regulation protein RsbU (phosphoserine phosphatase)
MGTFRRIPRPLLAILALAFAIAATLYSGLWMLAASRPIPVELGFDNKFIPESHVELIQSVIPNSPAERAGLKAGDRIFKIEGVPLEEDSLVRVWSQHRPGDRIELTVERPGIANPIVVHGVFRSSESATAEAGTLDRLGRLINTLFPVIFLTVAIALLFLRLDDPNAWLMALMFGSFIAIPGFANAFLGVPPALRPVAAGYRAIFNNLVAPLFYFFFATFPTRSAIDRRVPWLKWVGLFIGLFLGVPQLFMASARDASLGLSSARYGRFLLPIIDYSFVVLGFVSLALNAISAHSSEARRKIRVILWGTLVGVVPATVVLAANDFFRFHLTLWIGAAIVMLLWLFPLSFAYAVAKHRVLEVPILLRRSARYLLVQRGFVLLLLVFSIGITSAFALFFARYLQSHTRAAVPGGIALGTIFGSVLLWTGSRVHETVGKRIDRAFFRSAYNAQVILEDLVEKTRTSTSGKELAALLEHHLKEALQPSSVAVYFEARDDRLSVVAGDVPQESKTISPKDPALLQLAQHARPWEVRDAQNEVPPPLARLPFPPDCLVPILGRDDRLAGLIVLGSRLSEEPYSREDKHLLASVANHAGVALESFRLGEKVAERIEAERRAAQEMEFARQVQSRLFPQKQPPIKTLEYAGGCTPARTVGGDYYDFLELSPGRLGIVLADIAGKGVPGALLMANLQANLRSQYAMAIDELPRLLSSVSRLFYQSTDNASYATLFFADYNDQSHVLRYANCGHLPALLLRAPNNAPHDPNAAEPSNVVQLNSNCPVVGLFEEWHSEIAEIQLYPGDTFVLYTDGITEATNTSGEEFGMHRLMETVRRDRQLPMSELLNAIVEEVRNFSAGEQEDDITLVIARCMS